jgi:hypothetical protein
MDAGTRERSICLVRKESSFSERRRLVIDREFQ